LAKKVEISVDPQIDKNYPKHWSADVRIVTTKGNALGKFIEDPPGEPENPLPLSFIQEKYRRLAKVALSPSRVEEVEKIILSIEELEDIKDLTSLLSC
jgi:2-methylcitrate dehydratase